MYYEIGKTILDKWVVGCVWGAGEKRAEAVICKKMVENYD